MFLVLKCAETAKNGLRNCRNFGALGIGCNPFTAFILTHLRGFYATFFSSFSSFFVEKKSVKGTPVLACCCLILLQQT